MSRIYKRPMFRGGGEVSSYGNGIATGLADGGRINLGFGGALKGGLGKSNYSTSTKGLSRSGFRYPRLSSSLRALGQVGPAALRGLGFNVATGAAALPAAGIYGLMKMNSANTDEGLKVMKNEPSGTFDETGAFDMQDYSERLAEADTKGNKISFLDNFLLDPETGTYPKFIGRAGDREKRQAIDELEKNTDDFEVSGNAVKVNKDESALDAIMRTALERKKIREDIEDPEETNIKKDNRSAREKIAENKELFEEVMGGGKKAMIDDLSTMGLSFASKALKEGATTKSAFAEFFEDESKRPSRKSKISDAASNAAIQAYLTGEKSLSDLEKALKVNQAGIDYKSMKDKEARKSMTINDYVIIDKSGSTNKAIANGARKVIESNNLGTQGLQIIDKEQAADPKLLTEENKGEVFFDEDSQIVFMVVDLGDGQYGKTFLYR